LACVGFTGQLTGELSLCASVNLCAAIASQIAGDAVTHEDRAEILDGLREFVMALGGSFCDRMEMQGIEISLTEPLLGPLPTFSPGDQHHTITMTGDRGSAVFRVMVREG
jgi:CheY-specific phosphatase CheX